MTRMRTGIRTMIFAVVAIVATGCASAGSSGSGGSAGVLTREQLIETRQANLYAAIDALRARWLRPRAQTTLTQVNEVMVYMNDAPYGDVGLLRSLPVDAVLEVRYLSASEATGRYGTNVGSSGLILVRTTNE
jgi:hypothetical protein